MQRTKRIEKLLDLGIKKKIEFTHGLDMAYEVMI